VEFEYLVQTYDAAANTGLSDNKASNFLASPPVGAPQLNVIVSGAPQQAGWYLGAVSAEITSSQGTAITYSLDGGEYTEYDGPVAISGEGFHTLKAQDDAGASAEVVIPIDTVAPLVEATTDPPAGVGGVTFAPVQVTIEAIDPGGAGVASLTFEATGADPKPLVTVNGRTATFALQATGSTTITFSAIDVAGNASGQQSVTVQVEADPDVDRDGILNLADNCPVDANPLQENADPERRPNGPLVPGDDDTWVNHDALGNACDPDDDNDGLLDMDEANGALCAARPTNPVLLDSDGDHLTDGWECLTGSDPNNAGSKALGGGTPTDVDGDRVLDVWEQRGYNASPNSTDSDNDGCHDLVEVASVDGDRVITDEGNRVIGDSDRLSVARRRFGIWPADPVQDFVLDIDKNGTVADADRLFVARAALLPDWLPKSCP
jgi:hypothetical protein